VLKQWPNDVTKRVTTEAKQSVTRAAFEQALPALRPDIHRYCARMMGSVIDGEDILQIACMKAFEALERGDAVDNLRAWLLRIAHNTALDSLRARKREAAMLDETLSGPPAEANEMPMRSDIRDSLRPFLALTPGQRSSVIFRDVFGYTASEVADLTGGSVASVKAALHRGRAALKQSRAEAHEQEAAPLSAEERGRLTSYAEHFNARDFDRLRDMLAAEVRLDLVSRAEVHGRKGVGNYYSNYDRVYDWLMMPGQVEGRPAMLAFYPEDTASGPAYFILLRFDGDELHLIRDFRYARYAMADAEWARLS